MTFAVMGGGSSGDGYTGYRSPGSVRMTNYSNAFRWQRTFATTGTRTKWTFSMWLKRGTISTSLSSYERLLANANAGDEAFRFDGDRLMFYSNGGSSCFLRSYDRIYSTDGWYHIVLAVDTTQATSTDRVKMYVNNTQCSLGYSTAGVYPVQNYAFGVGFAGTLQFGNNGAEGTDMNIAEVSMVDNQQLTPSSFGEADFGGRWRPKQYTGTWGTNGFYIDFSDRSSANAMGLDKSGNGQNFTMAGGTGTITGVNSIISYDSPTPTSSTVANYARFAARFKGVVSYPLDGGLTLASGVTGVGNMGMSIGKWYWEVAAVTAAANAGMCYNVETTQANTSTISIPAGSTYGLKFDADAGTLEYTTNGSAWTSISTGLTTTPYRVYVVAGAGTAHLNHGQRPLTFAVPSGYKLLNSYNLPAPVGDPVYGMMSKYFRGTGAVNNITGFKFMPDLVMIHRETQALYMFDRSFTATNYLQPISDNGVATDGNSLTSYNSDGFTLGISAGVNNLNSYIVANAWKVSPTYGFDRVTYTGTGANATINHSLGATPGFILIKRKDTTSTWISRFGNQPNTDYFTPTLTNVTATDTTVWNSTSPTSSNFTIGTNVNVNAVGGSYVAYLFSEVRGYSKIGTYIGVGSSDLQDHVFCGFRPTCVIIKRMDSVTSSYTVMITEADLGNYATILMSYFGGSTNLGFGDVKFTATGFAFDTLNNATNVSGVTYAYIAFADAPPSYCLEGGI